MKLLRFKLEKFDFLYGCLIGIGFHDGFWIFDVDLYSFGYVFKIEFNKFWKKDRPPYFEW